MVRRLIRHSRPEQRSARAGSGNRAEEMSLPACTDTEVLIIGAGPAGSATAIALRQAGVDVTLADRHDFPRDKACGDALMPDTLRALECLGLGDRVLEPALQAESMRVHAPDGTAVDVPGNFACLPRRKLDQSLLEAARDAGVRFLPRHRVRGPIQSGDHVGGARFSVAGVASPQCVGARLTVLATGAAVEPLQAFQLLLRRTPSALALRAYYRVPHSIARTHRHLKLSYDAAICPGYGWSFPGPDNVFNIGVGIFSQGAGRSAIPNLRGVWDTFIRSFPPAREIVSRGRPLAPPRGAPLRCNLEGAQLHRPGLLVVGEAAGTTFPFSGEGIGKAMESGLGAAQAIIKALRDDGSRTDTAGTRYEADFRALHAARYRGYRRAQSWLAWPAMCNLIARRAGPGSFASQRLEDMIQERGDPGDLFSIPGLCRTFLESRPPVTPRR